MAAAPPSARSAESGWGDAAAIASVMSRTWNAIASTQARASWARPGAAGEAGDDAARLGIPPRAAEPGERGDEVTPPLSGTEAARGPTSAADEMMPSPSRSHWMAAPETKAEPSSA